MDETLRKRYRFVTVFYKCQQLFIQYPVEDRLMFETGEILKKVSLSPHAK